MTRRGEEIDEQVAATLLVEEVDAGEIPDTELAEGAGGPMIASFAATGVIQLMQAVIGVLLARLLGPSDRGELAAIILWPTLLTAIGSVGVAQAATYYAARAERLGAVVGSTLAFVVVDSVVLVGIGWVILPLGLGAHDSHVVWTAQLFLTAFVPLNLLAVSMMSVLNGAHRFGWFQGLRLVLIGVTALGIGLLAALGRLTVGSASVAYAVAYLVTALVALVVVLSTCSGRISVSRQTMRSLFGFGSRSALSQSMWTLNERADQLVISVFFSATSLGLYVVAVTLTSLTTLIGFSFAVVALPMVARLGSNRERQRVARLLVGATWTCATLASIPIFVLEPHLIRFFFGESFVDATGVGRVLLVAGVVFGLNRVLEALLQGVGRPLESSIGEGVALALTAAGLAVLLPAMGIMGAGVTSLIAYGASSAFMLTRAASSLDVSPLSLLRPEREALRALRAVKDLVPGLGRR